MISLLMLDEPTGNSNFWPLLIILGVFMIGMFAFSILPQRKKQKQMAEMSARIKVGDRIRTIGGIYGTIVGFDEDRSVYTILSGNSTFEIDRGCVYSMEMMGIKSPAEGATAPEEAKEEAAPGQILEESPAEEVKEETKE